MSLIAFSNSRNMHKPNMHPRPQQPVKFHNINYKYYTSLLHEKKELLEPWFTSKAAKPSLFVVFAEVWLIVPPDCSTQVVWCSHGTLAHTSTSSITLCCILLLKEVGVVVHATVYLVIFFASCFLLSG